MDKNPISDFEKFNKAVINLVETIGRELRIYKILDWLNKVFFNKQK